KDFRKLIPTGAHECRFLEVARKRKLGRAELVWSTQAINLLVSRIQAEQMRRRLLQTRKQDALWAPAHYLRRLIELIGQDSRLAARSGHRGYVRIGVVEEVPAVGRVISDLVPIRRPDRTRIRPLSVHETLSRFVSHADDKDVACIGRTEVRVPGLTERNA